jgi:hypothetical protein
VTAVVQEKKETYVRFSYLSEICVNGDVFVGSVEGKGKTTIDTATAEERYSTMLCGTYHN